MPPGPRSSPGRRSRSAASSPRCSSLRRPSSCSSAVDARAAPMLLAVAAAVSGAMLTRLLVSGHLVGRGIRAARRPAPRARRHRRRPRRRRRPRPPAPDRDGLLHPGPTLARRPLPGRPRHARPSPSWPPCWPTRRPTSGPGTTCCSSSSPCSTSRSLGAALAPGADRGAAARRGARRPRGGAAQRRGRHRSGPRGHRREPLPGRGDGCRHLGTRADAPAGPGPDPTPAVAAYLHRRGRPARPGGPAAHGAGRERGPARRALGRPPGGDARAGPGGGQRTALGARRGVERGGRPDRARPAGRARSSRPWSAPGRPTHRGAP